MTDTLTSEQKKFLEECEEEFKDRYTEKDNDFIKFKRQEPKEPPIVDPWYNKPRRQEWSRQHQVHGRRNHYYDRRNERNERYGRNERNERYERNERNERNERYERNERNERFERRAGKHFMHQRQRMC
ncbi:uncharacterized protein [Linepithema humile]|uniref:uncharacterized protein n=1 Tax=Linepithema humile TaxID=83485 RepID=UPI0006235BDE|nr:PREDICTED: RNMT-activating mini protein [Linepithema humile]